MRRQGFRNGFRGDGWVAVDLGSSATRVAALGGWFLRERWHPAGGGHAQAPGQAGVSPVAEAEILAPMFGSVFRLPWNPLRAAVGLPPSAGPSEGKAAGATLRAAGARDVATFPRGLAAAVGAGMRVGEPYACAVVDIGEALTECAVIRFGRIVEAADERVGCADLRRALIESAAERLGVPVTRDEAERVIRRLDFGARGGVQAAPTDARDAEAPRLLTDASTELLREALEPVLDRMMRLVSTVLGSVSHDAGAEIIESGIHLTGGGALLKGLRHRLERRTGVTVQVPEDPIYAVLRGTLDVLPVVAATGMWCTA